MSARSDLRNRRRIALLLAVLSLADVASARPAERAEDWSKVRRVIDGDTFELADARRVRLIGIDAPEYRPWEGTVEPYGEQASAFLRARLTGKKVRLRKDVSEYDRYGRLLRYAYTSDGEMVNLRMVQEGLAEVKGYPPDTLFQSELLAAQAQARKERKGLWTTAKAPRQRR